MVKQIQTCVLAVSHTCVGDFVCTSVGGGGALCVCALSLRFCNSFHSNEAAAKRVSNCCCCNRESVDGRAYPSIGAYPQLFKLPLHATSNYSHGKSWNESSKI